MNPQQSQITQISFEVTRIKHFYNLKSNDFRPAQKKTYKKKIENNNN